MIDARSAPARNAAPRHRGGPGFLGWVWAGPRGFGPGHRPTAPNKQGKGESGPKLYEYGLENEGPLPSQDMGGLGVRGALSQKGWGPSSRKGDARLMPHGS